jgi:hypothetical protein
VFSTLAVPVERLADLFSAGRHAATRAGGCNRLRSVIDYSSESRKAAPITRTPPDKQRQNREYYKASAAFGAFVDDLPFTMHRPAQPGKQLKPRSQI